MRKPSQAFAPTATIQRAIQSAVDKKLNTVIQRERQLEAYVHRNITCGNNDEHDLALAIALTAPRHVRTHPPPVASGSALPPVSIPITAYGVYSGTLAAGAILMIVPDSLGRVAGAFATDNSLAYALPTSHSTDQHDDVWAHTNATTTGGSIPFAASFNPIMATGHEAGHAMSSFISGCVDLQLMTLYDGGAKVWASGNTEHLLLHGRTAQEKTSTKGERLESIGYRGYKSPLVSEITGAVMPELVAGSKTRYYHLPMANMQGGFQHPGLQTDGTTDTYGMHVGQPAWCIAQGMPYVLIHNVGLSAISVNCVIVQTRAITIDNSNLLLGGGSTTQRLSHKLDATLGGYAGSGDSQHEAHLDSASKSLEEAVGKGAVKPSVAKRALSWIYNHTLKPLGNVVEKFATDTMSEVVTGGLNMGKATIKQKLFQRGKQSIGRVIVEEVEDAGIAAGERFLVQSGERAIAGLLL